MMVEEMKRFHCNKCKKDFMADDGKIEKHPAVKQCPYCGNRRIGDRIEVIENKGEE